MSQHARYQPTLRYLLSPTTLRDWLGLPALVLDLLRGWLRHTAVDEVNRRYAASPEKAKHDRFWAEHDRSRLGR